MSITTHVKDFEKQILPLSRHIKIKILTFLTRMLISKHVPFFSKTTKDPFGTKLTLKFYLGWRRCPLPCILHPIRPNTITINLVACARKTIFVSMFAGHLI